LKKYQEIILRPLFFRCRYRWTKFWCDISSIFIRK